MVSIRSTGIFALLVVCRRSTQVSILMSNHQIENRMVSYRSVKSTDRVHTALRSGPSW